MTMVQRSLSPLIGTTCCCDNGVPNLCLGRVRSSKCLQFVEHRVVDLTVEESNRLFDALQDWERQLAQFDLDDLRCDNDNFAP